MSIRQISLKCGVSKSTVFRVCSKKERKEWKNTGVRMGRPKRLDERAQRLLLRTFIRLGKENINLSIKHLLVQCGLNAVSVHQRTISRYLNQFGYKYLQARKKGVLTENDWKRRRVYTRKMKKIPEVSPDFYTNHIAFFLDGVSFVHKYNAENVARQPKARVWRRKSEGLDFTAKGSKDLPGGRRLHWFREWRHSESCI